MHRRMCIGDCFTRRGSLLSLAVRKEQGKNSLDVFERLRIGRLLPHSNHTGTASVSSHGVDLFSLFLISDRKRKTDFCAWCSPEELKLFAVERCIAEICFLQTDTIRIRSQGHAILFAARLREHEAIIDRLDGTFQLGYFDALGEFLFVPLRGTAELQSRWNWTKAGTERVLLKVEPEHDGIAEICIRYGVANVERPKTIPSFEACVADARKDFDAWCRCFSYSSRIPQEHYMNALWHTWNCMVGHFGKQKGYIPVDAIRIGASFVGMDYCAAAMKLAPEQAVALLSGVFTYQSRSGQLPMMVDDQCIDYQHTIPPLQGLTVGALIARRQLTTDLMGQLFPSLYRWLMWWHDERCIRDENMPVCYCKKECSLAEDKEENLHKAWVSPLLIYELSLLCKQLLYVAQHMGDHEKYNKLYKLQTAYQNYLIAQGYSGPARNNSMPSVDGDRSCDQCDMRQEVEACDDKNAVFFACAEYVQALQLNSDDTAEIEKKYCALIDACFKKDAFDPLSEETRFLDSALILFLSQMAP